jgi:predicted dehydrogenase
LHWLDAVALQNSILNCCVINRLPVFLAGVCDVVLERGEKIGYQFSVLYYNYIHLMIQNVDVDVVVVLTESGLHAEQCCSARSL